MSPEIVSNESNSKSEVLLKKIYLLFQDIYGIGVILYQIITKNYPN